MLQPQSGTQLKKPASSKQTPKIIKGDLPGTGTEVLGTDVAELDDPARSWPPPRRLVRIRHRVREDESRAGKRWLDVPGYRFQALGTSLTQAAPPPRAVWRYDHGRADCENVSKELQARFALPTLCREQFWASEAALNLARLADHLTRLFQRHLGWPHKGTLRH